MDPDPRIRLSFWSVLVGDTIAFTGVYGYTQVSVQRYSALPSLSKARACVVFSFLTLFSRTFNFGRNIEVDDHNPHRYSLYIYIIILFRGFRAVLLSIPGLVTLMTLSALTGLIIFAYYAKIGCDPVRDGELSNANQV